jgi:hypothetical protein
LSCGTGSWPRAGPRRRRRSPRGPPPRAPKRA